MSIVDFRIEADGLPYGALQKDTWVFVPHPDRPMIPGHYQYVGHDDHGRECWRLGSAECVACHLHHSNEDELEWFLVEREYEDRCEGKTFDPHLWVGRLMQCVQAGCVLFKIADPAKRPQTLHPGESFTIPVTIIEPYEGEYY